MVLFGLFGWMGFFVAIENANAFSIEGSICSNDSLQEVQAEGRNLWFKKCDNRIYSAIFSEGEFKMNGQMYGRRLYVHFGVNDGQGNFSFPGNWKAPTDPNASCEMPEDYEPIGVCTSL